MMPVAYYYRITLATPQMLNQRQLHCAPTINKSALQLAQHSVVKEYAHLTAKTKPELCVLCTVSSPKPLESFIM